VAFISHLFFVSFYFRNIFCAKQIRNIKKVVLKADELEEIYTGGDLADF
jgi:hypothetical protein